VRVACSNHLIHLDGNIPYYLQKISNYVPPLLLTGGTVVIKISEVSVYETRHYADW